MNKRSGVRSFQYTLSLVLLLCGLGQVAFAQFQTTIGIPYSTSFLAGEYSPGGIVLPNNGGFAVHAGNLDHPNSLFGPFNSDWELVLLNPNGTLASQSKWYGRPTAERAAWMELISCNGQDQLLFAGDDGADMTLSLTNLAGDPAWSYKAGSNVNVTTAACVKVDGGGNIVLVGTHIDASSGQQSVTVMKVDCQGNMLWNWVYPVVAWTAEAASVTTFSSFIGLCPQPNTNQYYITGKMSRMAGGGDPQVFILAVDATGGAPGFLKAYDVNPNGEDAGTTIQANCTSNPNGEIWVSGYSIDAGTNAKTAMMLKTDITGAPIWANTYDLPNGDEFATHFIFGPGGKLVVTGKAEETVVFQGTKDGNCMLMQIDGSGSTVDWARLYINNGFSSQGNRVEPAPNGGYFVTGQALEVATPNLASGNILALQTNNLGETFPPCFQSPVPTVTAQPPMVTTFPLAQLSLGQLDFFSNNSVDTLSYTDQQAFCAQSACPADFTWTADNCFKLHFTGTSSSTIPGNYTFVWDFDGLPPTPDVAATVGSNVHTTSFMYPCGGGTFTVTLTVTDPTGCMTTVTHTITVSDSCCGPILAKSADCTPNNNVYHFIIEVDDAPGSASCQQPTVTINSAVATLSNLNYSYNTSTTSWIISGFAQVVTSKTTNLIFTVNSVCQCPVTGLPMTCSQQVNIVLPCCKFILVDDQEICHDLNAFNVPIVVGNWSPLMMISQVSWYVLPKPAGGCPPNHWGGIPYQHNITTNLDPLHIYPNSLAPGEYCVYAVVHLDDGPCQLLTSNIATLTICQASSCTLNDQSDCYSGTPVVPGLLTLTLNTPAVGCQVTNIEWFDPQGSLVQTGGYTFAPIQGFSMQNDQLCYEDTFYTVKITDACGVHTCKARFRLYSAFASIGTLAMDPPEPPFLCATNSDATLSFKPECVGDPPMWDWFQQDCQGGQLMQLYDAGTSNGSYNIGQITESFYFSVQATNGDCPPKQTSLLVEYKSPVGYLNFDASPDPCVEKYVNLTLDIEPCKIEGCGTPCTCTYTVDWYHDGFFIGSTPNVTPPNQATFQYTTPPLYGSYFAVLKADCCPGESVTTYPLSFKQSCEPLVMGPCFVCDSAWVTLMGMMVQPPDDLCMDVCTFTWFYYDPNTQTETLLGTGNTWMTNYGGCYILESDCYDCIKRDTFKLGECYSNPCRRTFVGIEELFAEGQPPLRFYPNPASDVITVEWLGEAPLHARLNIVDLAGRLVRTIDVPDAAATVTISVDDLPSGMFFVQVQEGGRVYRAAKLVVE